MFRKYRKKRKENKGMNCLGYTEKKRKSNRGLNCFGNTEKKKWKKEVSEFISETGESKRDVVSERASKRETRTVALGTDT